MLLGVKVNLVLCDVFVVVVGVLDEFLVLCIEYWEICVVCKVGGVVWFDFVMLCGGLCL